MFPDGSIWRITLLKLEGRGLRALLEGLVHFGFAACCRINILQLADGKRRLGRILAGIILIEINQIRLAVAQFFDDESHLQAPVTQMYVTDHIVAQVTAHTLYALTDHGRTQVADMQRLCHVGSAVVHDDGLSMALFLHAKLFFLCHAVHEISQVSGIQADVNEARHHSVDLGKHAVSV